MIYARLHLDAGCERPDPPAGFRVERCGVEFYGDPDGGISRPGETCDAMLDRVAAGVRLMSFLYATDGARWVQCHWTTNRDWADGGHWSSWQPCPPPDGEVTL